MKRTFILILVLVLVFSFAACSNTNETAASTPTSSAEVPEAPIAEPAPPETPQPAETPSVAEAEPSAVEEIIEEEDFYHEDFPTPEAWISDGIDITGMLALNQYVFTAAEGEIVDGSVTTAYYGAYIPGELGAARFTPAEYAGTIAVFKDSAMTLPAEGVEAVLEQDKLTVSGVSEEENTAYYLATEDAAYPTTIYLVNSEYAKDTATLELADGTSLDLTTYAPNMAKGDYRAITDANEINGNKAVFIGGNRTAVDISDFIDKENIEGYEDAVAWYIQSGITNSGDRLDTFGDKMYGYEYAVSLYRLFQIVVDQTTACAEYADPTDFNGAMFSNDPYSDAVSATLQAGIWNGVYTQLSDTKDLGDGFYLLKNIDGKTTLGTGAVVTTEFVYVGLYNSFASNWTMLSEEGTAVAEKLAAAAADFDGAEKTAPEDYTNEAKIAAVSSVLMDEESAPDGDTELTKAEAVNVLYQVRDCVIAKTAPDESRVEKTGSAYADVSQFLAGDYADPIIVTKRNIKKVQEQLDGMRLVSTEGAALVVNNAGELTIQNNTVSLVGNADVAVAAITALSDPRYTLDGAEAVFDPTHDGFVYNATSRNAFYRFGVGTAAAIWGKDTVVNLRSNNGTLVLDGEADGSSTPPGNMAGTAYVGFGASLNITNAVAYSANQHLTNNLYNGTVHYVDANAIGSGRVYSSDFWGGYQVFEDSIAYGGSVTDEPTTLIVKNGVYGNSAGGNGYAAQYFENSILNLGTVTFQNMTSLVTDTGSFTAVNSVINSASDKLAATTGCERAIFTFVDSDITMAGNVLATVGNREQVNAITMETVAGENADVYQALYDGQMAIRFYGDVSIETSDGTITVDVAEGASLIIYSANLTEDDIVNTGAGEVIIVTDSAYGTVTVK